MKKSQKKILIITSGGSQLITQLSVLKNKINGAEVSIIYNGVFRESLEFFFQESATFYKFKYLGQINFDIKPIQITIKNRLIDIIKKNDYNLNNIIGSKFPLLKDLKNMDLAIIPIRVKMFADIVLLSFLNPKSILYVVDGVIDELPKRNFSKFRFPYLKNYLKSFPINNFVFSPIYLKNDANKIGVYKEIDSNSVLKELSDLSLVVNFKKKYLFNTIDYLIFSQHYSLSEGVSFNNEIEFYKRIIAKIGYLNNNAKILFKPHPRDTGEKIEAIKKLSVYKFVVIEEFFQAVPIEFFINEFLEMDSTFITGNSSAPLCFQKKDRVISVFSNELLSEKLNLKINEFAVFNELKLIEV